MSQTGMFFQNNPMRLNDVSEKYGLVWPYDRYFSIVKEVNQRFLIKNIKKNCYNYDKNIIVK